MSLPCNRRKGNSESSKDQRIILDHMNYLCPTVVERHWSPVGASQLLSYISGYNTYISNHTLKWNGWGSPCTFSNNFWIYGYLRKWLETILTLIITVIRILIKLGFWIKDFSWNNADLDPHRTELHELHDQEWKH